MRRPRNHCRVRCGPTRRMRLSARSSTSFAMRPALGRSNEVSVMSTPNATARRRLPRLPLFALVIGVLLLRLSSPVFADGGGGCGPQASRGTGCQPTPNPAPLTLAFSMPGRNDAVAVTLTLTRGLQQDRNGPAGAPPEVQV